MDFTKLTAFLDSLEEAYGVRSADCIVTREHETVYRHMTGHSDPEGKYPVDDKDLYYLYSCTKVITCTAVLQLIEQGAVQLYDPVGKYLPEYAVMKVANEFDGVNLPGLTAPCHFSAKQIRIIDLMAMMGGLTYEVTSEAIRNAQEKTRVQGNAGAERNAGAEGNDRVKGSTRDMVAAIAEMPLIYEPGTRWYYSLAHDVLAAVVETVSGEGFGEYLHHHIFGPLGIKNDMFFHLDQEQEKRLSAIYAYDSITNRITPCGRDESYKFTDVYESGGAGLIGTVSGYSAVLEALACGGRGRNGERILKEETVRMFSVNVTMGQALRDVQLQEGPEYGYGLGVRVKINEKRGLGPIGEFGWGGAAGAYVCVDPAHHVSIFFATHVMNFGVCGREFHPLIRDYAYEGVLGTEEESPNS